MKENKGVSMITLVITIIVIIILASVAFNSSTETIGTANYSNYVNNVSEVQQAFSLAVANRKGEEAQKGKIKKTEQVVNAVATGSSTYKLNSEAKALAYTIIDEAAETELGIELPKMTVESLTSEEVEVKYAVTPDGTVFAWPPIENDGEYYSAGDITAVITETTGTVTIDGNTPITITIDTSTGAINVSSGDGATAVSREGLSIGDYVNYTPNTSTTSKTLTTTETGHSSSQTISQETLSWQILDIESDGTVKLMSTLTNATVTLNGANGYNNGVKALNDVCSALYSNTAKGITARSVNYEDDYEPYLTSTGTTTRNNYSESNGCEVGTTLTYTDNTCYPKVFAQEKGSGINTTIASTTGLAGNEYLTTNVTGYDSATKITTTGTYWSAEVNINNFGEQGDVLYDDNWMCFWIASRCIRQQSTDLAYFGIRMLDVQMLGNMLEEYVLFDSACNEGNLDLGVRAIVEIPSTVDITPCTGTNSASNTHTIAW